MEENLYRNLVRNHNTFVVRGSFLNSQSWREDFNLIPALDFVNLK